MIYMRSFDVVRFVNAEGGQFTAPVTETLKI